MKGKQMTESIVAVCTSDKKGIQKTPVQSIVLREDHGIVGDAHAGGGDRQVSLLAGESVDKMREKGLALGAGAFGENIVTRGIALTSLPVGTRLRLGEALLEVSRIGKECHSRCAIYYQAGDCVMPKEGIFARVVEGGSVKAGDPISIPLVA
mgnify:FL=1